MTKKISAFAVMAFLATSFAFAADNTKRASTDDATATQAATTNHVQQDSSAKKDNNKDKHNAKPAPSTQEREFDKVLQGIYG